MYICVYVCIYLYIYIYIILAYPGFGHPGFGNMGFSSDLKRRGRHDYGSRDEGIVPKLCAPLKTPCTEDPGLLYPGLCTTGVRDGAEEQRDEDRVQDGPDVVVVLVPRGRRQDERLDRDHLEQGNCRMTLRHPQNH